MSGSSARGARTERVESRRETAKGGGGSQQHGPTYRAALSGVRARVRDRPDLHLRVVLRPARGRLRLRRHPGHDQPGEDRSRAARIWRYSDLLPVDRNQAVDLGAGFTPLVRADRLAAELGLGEVWVKNDTLNPTNSFKDRVASVALSKALEFGFKTAACASTGNLANSVAAHAAHAGLRSFVFIPANLEQGKIVTTAVYGGNVVAIDGNYDDVNRLCAELAGTYHWAFVNVNVRPFYAEGSKTLAFETAEQLGWEAPDHVVVPIASGSLLTKIRKGFDELYKVGLLDEEPQVRVSGAQALGCSPVATAWLEESDTIRPVKPDTIAKSLAIGNPADGYFALDACARPAAGSRRSPTARSSTASGCSPAPRGSSPRPPAA